MKLQLWMIPQRTLPAVLLLLLIAGLAVSGPWNTPGVSASREVGGRIPKEKVRLVTVAPVKRSDVPHHP